MNFFRLLDYDFRVALVPGLYNRRKKVVKSVHYCKGLARYLGAWGLGFWGCAIKCLNEADEGNLRNDVGNDASALHIRLL